MTEQATLPAPGQSATVLLNGDAGPIEVLVATPTTPPVGVAVVCHPHPLHGGALTNKVAYTLATTAQRGGFAVARFNFRGVGKSAGAHDEGRGETDDTVAVAKWLQGQVPGARLLLAGFSFGAFVSLKAAAHLQPALQVSIAPPFKYFSSEPMPPRPPGPWLVVHSTDDDVVPFEETRQSLAHYQPPPELAVMEDAGHFFHGKLGELQSVCAGFIETNWPHSA